MNGFRPRTLTLPIGLLASLALASPAMAADERFASPTGSGSGDCIATACTLTRAVEIVAVDGDTVTMLPGTYSASDVISISKAIVVRGAVGQARPVLNTNATNGGVLVSNQAATLRRLEIVHAPPSGTTGALNLSAGVAEQVIARSNSTSGSANACRLSGFTTTPVLRDTFCISPNQGASVSVIPGSGAHTASVRNVTAIANDGEGIFVNTAVNDDIVLDVVNTIARGGGGETDIEAQHGGGGSATVNLTNSNYVTILENDSSITDPDTGANNSFNPVFVAAGDFHQAANSVTRDAGIGVAGLGSKDVDGQPRTMGSAPDVGADEFTDTQPDADSDGVPDVDDACPSQPGPATNNGCPLPPADTGGGQTGGGDTGGGGGGGATLDTDDPETEITKQPKKELRAGDTAKVSFESDEDGSTFECRVGKGKFKDCASPHKIKDLEKGKTKFQVRAIDAAGNVDETPAKATIEADGGGKG